MNNMAERLKEIERRGLLERLSEDKQARWVEYKRRHPEEFAPKSTKTLGDYFVDEFKNDFADVGYGAKKALSGITWGASDWALRKLGLDNEQEYLARKDDEGLGTLARGLGFGAELGGNVLGAGGALVKGLNKAGLKGLKLASTAGGTEGLAYGLTGSDRLADIPENMALGAGLGAVMPLGLHGLGKGLKWGTRPITDKISHYAGKRNLTKQLNNGKNFKDVHWGNMDDRLVNDINTMRNIESVEPMDGSAVSVPADRVNHIYMQRVLDNKYSPSKTAEVIHKALFSKNSKVARGNHPHLQIVYDGSDPANAVVIGKHRNTGDIFVKTSMQKDKRLLDGRSFPSYTVDANAPSPQQLRLSGFQEPHTNNISSNLENVNSSEKRSFVEALANRDKARVMRNAVLSGADDLSERARTLQDLLVKRKDGWFDADFEKLIKTPELARAEEKYAQFIAKNGKNTLSPDKVAAFYEQHPIAENMIAEMREVDPRAFDNILPGSLAEFDMLKKTLREEAGNKIKVGASKSGALKRAENTLKNMMDDEFSGFKEVNQKFADAKSIQNIFESKLKQGLTSVGGGTANTSPFWSGISSPLTAAGVVSSFFNPASLAVTAAGLGGKALLRNARRNVGRRLADGIIQTPVNVDINPNLSAGLSAETFNNFYNR